MSNTKKAVLSLILVVSITLIGLLIYYVRLKDNIGKEVPTLKKSSEQEAFIESLNQSLDQAYLNQSFSKGVIFQSKDIPNNVTYSVRGVTNGVPIRDPFPLKKISGKLLATNKLAFKLYILDINKNIVELTVPLIAELPNGDLIIFDEWWDLWGLDDESMKNMPPDKIDEWFTSKLIKGRVISPIVVTSLKDLQEKRSQAESAGNKIKANTNREKLYLFLESYLEGRENNLKEFIVTGETKELVIVPIHHTSSLYSGNPWIIDTKSVKFHDIMNKTGP